MIKLIVFDLDDTLYNERDFVYGAFKEVCDCLSNKYDIGSELLFEKCVEILNSEGRGKIFNLLCEAFDIEEDILSLINIYRYSVPSLMLYDDADYILKELKGHYDLGIITDGMASVQWNKVKCLGLDKVVDKIIVTDDFGREYWKPHSRAFKEMLLHFHLQSSEAMYIGDNPNKDFIGAREVGYKTIRIIREEGDHMTLRLEKHFEADFEITSLKEIINYI